ncbi:MULTISPECIES: hypothetical protein [Azorhizobium]|nr:MULTISPECIES: hypothetical protein [Azorhizobium]TDT90317.1 hypothetical protein DFO45_4170 [Azorhizobium sp. AG788]
MRRPALRMAFVLATALLTPGLALAQPILEITVVRAVQSVAKVSALDLDKRVVTLVAADGNWSALKAGPEVKNLPQVKVGDEIKLVIEQVTNISVVHPNDGTPVPTNVVTVDTAPLGAKPGAVVTDRREFAATITALAADTRSVTLQGPAGNSLVVPVPANQPFEQLKAGDHVIFRQVTFTGLADIGQ